MNILAISLYIFLYLLMFSGAGRAAIEDYETPPFRFSARTEVVDEQAAELHISCILTFNDPGAKIKIQLIDPQDNTIYNDVADKFIIDNWIQQADVNIPIQSPDYWNAERPALYRIRFEVIRSNGEPIIEERRIGLAQYAIRDHKLVCNQTPLVIQGVQYAIENSAPFTIDDFRKDVALMQQMNFNAVRVIGGEAPQDFMQVCDEMGMYVLIDVKEKYTAPTILTYQNHPSVIAWNLDARSLSVEDRDAAVQRIKNFDNSHPLFVQFDSIQNAEANADGYLISGPPRSDWRFLGTSNKPTLACGLLPAIDNSIEGLDDFIAMARTNSSLRGGFMQQFANQHSSEEPKPITNALFNDRSAQRQWANGFDGLVDVDRTPQLDFWQARQALDWIEIQEREADFRPNRSIELSIKNWNAFTNLNDYIVFWFILENGAVLEHGEMTVNLPPQRSMKIAVRPQRAQPNPDANTYLLMQFIHEDRIASEHSVWLKPKTFEQDFTMRLRDLTWDKDWTVTTDIEESRIDHRDFIFHTRTADCAWFLLARESNMRLITEGPYLRLNRSLT
ncbi:DUF4981 domain-containing protein, partial [bacterium]|nr:DUF4981 domain-containing protein [bacterium]